MTQTLRLATYNVEWFTGLFGKDGRFLNDGSESGRFGMTKAQQFAAIGRVLQAVDADVVMLIEAPDHGDGHDARRALQGFAAHFGLRARRALIGFPSQTKQEIALLYDPDRVIAAHMPMGDYDIASAAPRFDMRYPFDLDHNGSVENIGFSKPPLEVSLTVETGEVLRLIGVHLKSKAAHGARGHAAFMRASRLNRRKQLAECLWLRGRIDEVLQQGTPLIVLGDFNDGPGLDEYERELGYSSVEVVAGLGRAQDQRLYDPSLYGASHHDPGHHDAGHDSKTKSQQSATMPKAAAMPVTSRFYLPEQNGYFEALLDFIMVSPALAKAAPVWRIWHPLHDAGIAADQGLCAALLAASDHFPVTIEMKLPIGAPTA